MSTEETSSPGQGAVGQTGRPTLSRAEEAGTGPRGEAGPPSTAAVAGGAQSPPAAPASPSKARHGRLWRPQEAPSTGEETEELASSASFRVCQVASGALQGPVDFLQDHDEFALVVRGQAVLELPHETLQLGPGDWVWLPAGTPHRLVGARAGTIWLTAHGRAASAP